MIRSAQVPRVTAVVAAVGAVAPGPLRTGLASLAGDSADGGLALDGILAGPATAELEATVADCPGWSLLRLPDTTTWAAAVNEAVAAATGAWVLVADAGAALGPGALGALFATASRRADAGVVAGVTVGPDGDALEAGPLLWSDGTLDLLGGAPGGPYDFERRLDASAGAALLVRRDIWEALDGLDGAYHPDVGAEKLDLCLRAGVHGWSTWYQPAAVVVSSDPGPGILDHRALATFARRWSTLLADRDPPGAHEAALWRTAGEPLRVLVVDDELPDPRRGSGYGRMHDVLAVLDADPGLQVSFHPRLDPGSRPVAELASLAGARTRVVVDLEGHLASDGVDFDVVVVSRPDNASRYRDLLARRLPGVPVVYDAEALFFRRLERQAGIATGDEREALLREAERMAELERDLAGWADRVVTISAEEAADLRPATSAPVHVVGPRRWGARPTPSGFEARSGGCLVAGWAAGPGSPNADGLVWFAREVLPAVSAALPSFRLLVSGDDPPADVRWAAGPEVVLLGGLPELAGLYDRVRVAISPTRFGAGVKLKTVEAIQHGVPVVCTPEAAAGLTADLAAAAWVAPDAAGFADAVVALSSDRRAWQRARVAALAAAGAPGNDPHGPPDDPTVLAAGSRAGTGPDRPAPGEPGAAPAGVEQWPAIIRAALAGPASGRTS